ncbi:MAG: long-chain fatty acid--CoA ligase [SAR324 cluster bacterium]|nr:long-chain fatty acid--CoA ligase [SAR324 cluster bacterium]
MPGKYKNLVDMQEKSCATFKDRELLGTKNGKLYEWITYGEFAQMVDHFRGGLASLGVGPQDKVAIISNNSVQWAVAAYATYGLKGIFVPMYESQSMKEWKYIIQDSGSKVLLVANDEIYSQVENLPSEIECLQHVVDLAGSISDHKSYKYLLKVGEDHPASSQHPEPDDLMGLIYTSGTTGDPKGVLLSHGNIMSNVNAIEDILDVNPDDRSLSFLPWAHSFGQTVELHCLVSCGASSGFAENVTTIIENLAEVQPTLLFSVPRIFNKIYDGVQNKMNADGGVAKFLFDMGMQKATLKKQHGSLGLVDSALFWLADTIVFNKIRGRFGGRLRYAVSGAAALSKEVADFIDNMGILVYEGYGLSETSPMVTANSKAGRRIGSVGKPIPHVTVTLDKSVVGEESPDGEIVVHGPNVMKGYHNKPEETASVMTADGGFRTGDLGRFDSDGFLYITGRIKEQYKLENGKYVVPSPLEEKLKLSQYIEQVMIYGDGRLYNVALIVPARDMLQKFAGENGISSTGTALLHDHRIVELIKKEIATYGASFKGYEVPKKFALLEEDWGTENGILTPTLKLKRRIVVDKYKDMIESLYTA